MGLAYSGVCKLQNSSNPMFGASTTFMNRDTGCRSDAQRWADLTSRWSIGIDAAFDLCHALLMADDHCGDRDCAAYEDGADRDQQST
jgi:hypothetical protein